MPKKVNTHPRPAMKPARAPDAPPAPGPINIARKKDAINDRIKANPNNLAMFASLADSSVMPVSFIHLFAKRRGEYHNPPRMKALTAAAITASQFRLLKADCISIDVRFNYKSY
jgi:hypothetical protein